MENGPLPPGQPPPPSTANRDGLGGLRVEAGTGVLWGSATEVGASPILVTDT